jgi:hypothetical protein
MDRIDPGDEQVHDLLVPHRVQHELEVGVVQKMRNGRPRPGREIVDHRLLVADVDQNFIEQG